MLSQENQSTKKKKGVWRLLAKSLGEKAGKNDKEADKIALIRLLMFVSIFITNCFIVAGVIKHWNDEPKIHLIIDGTYAPDQVNESGPLKVHL